MPGGDRSAANGALVIALARGATVEEAAKASGVSSATAWRRLRDPAFRLQIDQCRGEVLDAAVGRLAELSTTALDGLANLLVNDNPKLRLAAIRTVLEFQFKGAELHTLVRQLQD